MVSKAKSGLSAVRMFVEDILSPPITFTEGSSATFTSDERDGKGHSEIHVSVVNNTSGILRIVYSWIKGGTFTLDAEQPTALDAISSLHTASIKCSIRKRFYKIQFIPDTDLGAAFELGGFFQPRSSGDPVVFAGGISVPAAPAGINKGTGATPAAVSAGTSSGLLLAADVARKGAIFTVTTAGRRISLGLDNETAVLDSGITVFTATPVIFDAALLSTGIVNVIADQASTNVAVQELT